MGIEDTEDQSQRRRLPTRIHEQEQAAMHTQPSAQGPIRSSTTPRSSALRTEYYRSPLDMQEQSGSGEGTLPGYLCGNQMSEVIGERMYEDHMRASMANDPIHTTTNTIRSVPHLSAYDPTPKTSRAMSNISTRAQRGSPPPTSDVTPGLDSGIASFHRTGARIEEEPMDEQWSASASRGDTPFAARVGDAPRVVSQQGYSGVTATSGSSKPVGDASRAGSQRLYGGTTATSSASKPPTIHVGDLGRPISKEEQKAQQLRQQQQSWESAARNIN
ncbi:hypothetical protein BDQ17DRAFT_391998 [Cyathus striatus]|nr:hypothetical protein BDQ17DRAFT_391998 [Cyathus striatus]